MAGLRSVMTLQSLEMDFFLQHCSTATQRQTCRRRDECSHDWGCDEWMTWMDRDRAPKVSSSHLSCVRREGQEGANGQEGTSSVLLGQLQGQGPMGRQVKTFYTLSENLQCRVSVLRKAGPFVVLFLTERRVVWGCYQEKQYARICWFTTECVCGSLERTCLTYH